MDAFSDPRIIVLVDMDCFYVQVEQKCNPGFENKPCSVVQYNTFQGGGIIAVNYEARACGVKRGMRGDQAKKVCPEIHNFRVPEVRGKADLTRYREAGASVIEVLTKFCNCVERASVDEAFLDMTSAIGEKSKTSFTISADHLPNTYVVGWDKDSEGDDLEGWLENINENADMENDRKLTLAAKIVEEIRAEVFAKTGFRCSAGIAHNKMLSKLACGLHKPNKQTILPHGSVQTFFRTLPVNKIRNLGGKLGEEIQERLGVEMMGDLTKYTKAQLGNNFGEKTGTWLFGIAQGFDNEPVVARQLPKSIGCGKNFRGKETLTTKHKVQHWLQQLSTELEERLLKDQLNNHRFAKSLTVTARFADGNANSTAVSRSCPINVYNSHRFANDTLNALQKLNTAPASGLLWNPPLIALQLCASKFEDTLDVSSCNISSYFSAKKTTPTKVQKIVQSDVNEPFAESTNDVKEADKSVVPQIVQDISVEEASVSGTSVSDKLSKNTKTNKISNYFAGVNSELCDIGGDKKSELGVSSTSTKSQTKIVFKDTAEVNELGSNEHDVTSDMISDNTNIYQNTSENNEEKDNLHIKIGFFAKKLQEKVALSEVKDKSVSNPIATSNILLEERSSKVNSAETSTSLSHNEPISFQDEGVNMAVKSNKGLAPIFKGQNSSKCPQELSEIKEPEESTSDTGQPFHSATSELSKEVTFLCMKCEKRFAVWEEQEHLDFHFALEMQNTGEASIKPAVLNNSKPVTKTKNVKKRTLSKKTSQSQKRTKSQTNTLDSFIR